MAPTSGAEIIAPPGIGRVPINSGAIARAILREGIDSPMAAAKASIAPDFFMAAENAMIEARRTTSNIRSGFRSSSMTASAMAESPSPCHSAMTIPPSAVAMPRGSFFEAAITTRKKITNIFTSAGMLNMMPYHTLPFTHCTSAISYAAMLTRRFSCIIFDIVVRIKQTLIEV